MTMLALLLRMALALGVVVAVMWALSRLGGKARRRSGGGASVDVIARRGLARGANLSLVRVGARVLLVGTTAQSMNVLADMTGEDLALAPGASGQAFEPSGLTPLSDRTTRPGDPSGAVLGSASTAWMADLVDQLRERTVRR